jgi:aryl-alcohol dehydrogenase-like predicted oxidoreductase
VYGFGKSEIFLGEFMKATGTSPIIATKYAPQPWRLTQGSVPAACKASLERLQLQQMGLYIQHWPGFFFNAFSNDAYLQGLADCVDQVRPWGCCDSGVGDSFTPHHTTPHVVLAMVAPCLLISSYRQGQGCVSCTAGLLEDYTWLTAEKQVAKLA